MSSPGSSNQAQQQEQAQAYQEQRQQAAQQFLANWLQSNPSPTSGMQNIKGPGQVTTAPIGGGTFGGPSGGNLRGAMASQPAPAPSGANSAPQNAGAVPQSVNPAHAARQQMLGRVLALLTSGGAPQGGAARGAGYQL